MKLILYSGLAYFVFSAVLPVSALALAIAALCVGLVAAMYPA